MNPRGYYFYYVCLEFDQVLFIEIMTFKNKAENVHRYAVRGKEFNLLTPVTERFLKDSLK